MFKDKVLLITGGTGSFGNTVAKKFLDTDQFKEIRILSRDEKKQDDMRKHYNDPRLKFFIGDVRDTHAVNRVMAGVDYVFHAAALKQVPSCEFHPLEAVNTNVIGTSNVIEAAIFHNVDRVIVLSTDKAAYPINAMGISKAMAEKVATARARLLDTSNTIVCVTRYGNVMASRGSVIPLFIDQIKAGKSISITNPDMTRFLMSLEEAVDLVLYAFENGRQGDLFVQKAPASTIQVLAQALIELFDGNPEIDIIGTRHGEKMHETLLTSEERQLAIDEGDYFRVPVDNRDLNYTKYVDQGISKENEAPEDYRSSNTRILNCEEVKQTLLKLDYVQNELDGWGKPVVQVGPELVNSSESTEPVRS